MSDSDSLVINGWTIYMHPLFIQQVDALTAEVQALQAKDPVNYTKKNPTKRLFAIQKLAFQVIPQDPTLPEYRQGKALGEDYKHWFRAKFFQQYRLFFRYHKEAKIIVYVRVNDESTKRAYGSKSDAYHVFAKMLESNNHPDNWEALVRESLSNSDELD